MASQSFLRIAMLAKIIATCKEKNMLSRATQFVLTKEMLYAKLKHNKG